MKKIILKAIKKTISLINSIFPKNSRRVIFKSVPDFSGNCLALSNYIEKSQVNFQVVWFHNSDVIPATLRNSNIKLVRMKGFLWLYHFFRSKHIATTHNEMVSITAHNQNYLSLWHGMPLKKICYLADNEVNYMEDYAAKRIATSEVTKAIISAAFHEKANNVFITGQPRNDFLFEKEDLSEVGIELLPDHKTIIYAPTYRHNKYSDLYSNGDKIQGEDLFRFNQYNLKGFNEFLRSNRIQMLIKLHPFEEDSLAAFDYSNLKVVKSEDLKKKNLDINHLLSYADCLLTDYSSTYIDYLILDRPIGFIIPDYEAYQNFRGGFTLEPAEFWMPGIKIKSEYELVSFITEVINNDYDECAQQRSVVNASLNRYKSDNSKRVFENLIKGNNGK